VVLAAIASTESLLRHGPWLVFVFLFGACVGSFINVVNWRLPRGMSMSHPPSRCPTCGGRLRFFRENLPILGWVVLRGRCRFCQVRISPVYPFVELMFALVFTGLYVCLFMGDVTGGWCSDVGGFWWVRQQFMLAWPAYVAVAFLFAGLYAMTVIDARTFLIPIEIPTFVSAAALCLWLIEGVLARPAGDAWPIPGTGWALSGVALGGLVGVGVSQVLLLRGILRPSFADYEAYVREDSPLADYPHARREMFVEMAYLALPVVGMIVGGLALAGLDGVPPRWVQSIGGAALGWLVGGGLVWGVRILGTLCFGREAMGLGDVHLLAAVGAVLGWFLPVIIFFVAPFLGLAWTVAAAVGSRWKGGVQRELPYGPHLAVATLVVFLGQGWLDAGWRVLMPTVEMPRGGLVQPVDNSVRWTSGRPAVSMHPGARSAHSTEGTTDRCGKETRPCV